jgi:hypothetical protein
LLRKELEYDGGRIKINPNSKYAALRFRWTPIPTDKPKSKEEGQA